MTTYAACTVFKPAFRLEGMELLFLHPHGLLTPFLPKGKPILMFVAHFLSVKVAGTHRARGIFKPQPSELIQLQSQQTVIIETWLWHVVIIHSAA